MNKLDSENVAAVLEDSGYSVVDDLKQADIILMNTCGVREKAEDRIHGRLGELSSMRVKKPHLMFGVIGCMAQRLESALLSKVVSIVAGPDSYRRLPELLHRARQEQVIDTMLNVAETYDDIEPVRSDGHSAWVAVMRGCNNFCSYCIVPYTRGRERSLARENVIGQVERLVEQGFSEVTLLGQNVNSYHDGDTGFAELLAQIADTGIPWIRFLTSHPADLSDDILSVMAERDSICPHLHLPLQSGSDNVLKAMRRRYSIEHYLSVVDKAREYIDGLAVTTDLIFGFPGETEEDYQATIDVMNRVRFDYGFLYRYSEREGTKACDLEGHIPEELRYKRLNAAIAIQQKITSERHEELVGSTQRVLIKDRSKDGKGWFGFSGLSIPVVVRGLDESGPGSFADVTITGTTGASLIGKCS